MPQADHIATDISHDAVESFIERWQNTGGKERANYQLFLTELSQLLGLPGPEPASDNPHMNSNHGCFRK